MSEGKYEGTPNQKINIQVLVYGEFSKYTQDYDLVDSVDNKGKQSKVKRYKGTYSKVAETSTRWDWVPLDKIQQIYVDYDQNTTKDKFGYTRSKPRWSHLNDDESAAREKALANEHDNVALGKRTAGPKSGEEVVKLEEKKKVPDVKPSPEEPSKKKPKKTPKDGSDGTSKSWMDTWKEEEMKKTKEEIQGLKNEKKDLEVSLNKSEAEVKSLDKKLQEANKIVDKYNNLPSLAKTMTADTLDKFTRYEAKFKTLARSAKTHFEGELLTFNRNITNKKDFRTLEDVAPSTLIEQWDTKDK